jgi:hypothetical protein
MAEREQYIEERRTVMDLIGKISENGVSFSPAAEIRISDFARKNVGKDCVVKYEVVGDVKSYEQLKFYFGVLIPAFVQATGETNREKLDAYLRDKYLSSVHEIHGEKFKYIPTLQIGKNKVNRATMTKYIEDCLNELADCGGSLPMNVVEEYREAMLSNVG